MKDKGKNKISIIFGLLKVVGPFSFVMLLAVLNGVLGTFSAFAIPVLGSLAVIKALGAEVDCSYGLLIGLAVGFGVLRGLLRYLEQYSNHFIAFKILAILRDKVFCKLTRLSLNRIEEKERGGLLSLLTSDVETLEVFYAHTLSPILIAVIFSLFVFLCLYLWVSPVLALVAILAYLAIGLVLPGVSYRSLKEEGRRYRRDFAGFSSYFLDSIQGVRNVLLFRQASVREEEIERRSSKLLKTTNSLKRKTALSSGVTEVFVTLSVAVFLAIAAVLISRNELSVFSAIVGTTMLFSSFGPVIALANLPGNLTQTFASGERLLSLLAEADDEWRKAGGTDFTFERMTMKNVSFGYGNGENVLQNACLSIGKGEIVGIKGDSGEGKSTLLKLILGFEKPREGEIDYGDTPIEKISTKSLRDNVTLVSQKTYLFNGTISDNLRIAKPDCSFGEMQEACRKASIDELISALPKGYETPVGELGERFSAGERQRLGLARAFLRDSPLILLDEPTSNVDSINEGIILSSILNERKSHAFILVSHRNSTMAISDRTYFLKNKELKEEKEYE